MQLLLQRLSRLIRAPVRVLDYPSPPVMHTSCNCRTPTDGRSERIRQIFRAKLAALILQEMRRGRILQVTRLSEVEGWLWTVTSANRVAYFFSFYERMLDERTGILALNVAWAPTFFFFFRKKFLYVAIITCQRFFPPLFTAVDSGSLSNNFTTPRKWCDDDSF